MIIRFSPQRSNESVTLEKVGEKLIVNGETFDFSVIPDMSILPKHAIDSRFFVSDVVRKHGTLELSVLLPYQNIEDQNRLKTHEEVLSDGLIEVKNEY